MNRTDYLNYSAYAQQAQQNYLQEAARRQAEGLWGDLVYDPHRMMYYDSRNRYYPVENLSKAKRTRYGKWRDRVLRLKEKDLEKKLRLLRTVGWYTGLLWGTMLLVVLTAKIFQLTVWATIG